MPDTTTRPVQAAKHATASAKRWSSEADSARNPTASAASTARAVSISSACGKAKAAVITNLSTVSQCMGRRPGVVNKARVTKGNRVPAGLHGYPPGAA